MTSSASSTRRTVAVLTLACCGLLASCGAGGSGDESQDAASLEDAARSAYQRVLDGDYGAAYERLSDECQSQVTKESFVDEATTALEYAETLGYDLSQAEIVSVRARDVRDGRGEVELVLQMDGEEDGAGDWNEFVYQDGEWRVVDCGDTPTAATPATIDGGTDGDG